jgi:hypothetical protein
MTYFLSDIAQVGPVINEGCHLLPSDPLGAELPLWQMACTADIDLPQAILAGKLSIDGPLDRLIVMARACGRCSKSSACARFLAEASRGTPPPAFCPIKPWLDDLR